MSAERVDDTIPSRLILVRISVMDPVLILNSISELMNLCSCISAILPEPKNVETTFQLLLGEVNQLAEVLGYIRNSAPVENPHEPTTLPLQTGHEAEYWQLVHQAMKDCKDTLESLERATDIIRLEQNQSLRRPRGQWELDSRSREIGEFRRRIVAFTSTMKIAFQLLKTFVTFLTDSDKVVQW